MVARFARRFIDANRPPEVALDHPDARPGYDLYHGWLRRFVDQVRARHPAGLLIDVHGQHKDPDVVMRGTVNGRTITRLLARAGQASITGREGLFGQLEAKGLPVFPANDLPKHQETCGSRTKLCELCLKYVKLSAEKEHLGKCRGAEVRRNESQEERRGQANRVVRERMNSNDHMRREAGVAVSPRGGGKTSRSASRFRRGAPGRSSCRPTH